MKPKDAFNKINSSVELKDGKKITIFGIELESLELPPRADKKVEWEEKEIKIPSRFLFAYYNEDKERTEVYVSAYKRVFTYFGKPEDLIEYKEIKQIYDAVLPDTYYVIGAKLLRKSDELEVQYMKYPEVLKLNPGDTVRVPLTNSLSSFKEYVDLISTIEIKNVLLMKANESQKASCDSWKQTSTNEDIVSIYGIVYSRDTN